MTAHHRAFVVTSPNLKGPDVEATQHDLNWYAKRFQLDTTGADGEWGPDSKRLASQVLFLMGALRAQYQDALTAHEQQLVSHHVKAPGLPQGISLAARRRSAARRKAHTKKVRTLAHGPEALVKEAEKWIGTKEHPANSNTGPHISDWQHACGMGAGPWCGAFFIHCARHAGFVVPDTWRYVPAAVADARAGRYGYVVPRTNARRGDAICFDWDGNGVFDHIGAVASGGARDSCEGNTTSGSAGDQSNGGTVAHRIDHYQGARATVCIRLTKRS